MLSEKVEHRLLCEAVGFPLAQLRPSAKADPYQASCAACGVTTSIDLLDAKPTYPGCPDWERFECAACYGPGWAMYHWDLVEGGEEIGRRYDTLVQAYLAKEAAKRARKEAREEAKRVAKQTETK